MNASRTSALLALVAAAAAGPAAAQDDATEVRQPLRIEPVLLDSENSDDTSLGVSFDFEGTFGAVENDEDDSDDGSEGNGPINPDVVLGGRAFDYAFSGTITQDGSDNPENLIEAEISAKYFRSAPGRPAIRAGGFIEYESDQDFDDTQIVYGGTITLAKLGVFGDNNYFALDANIGQVDPKDDAEREAVLGPVLETYTRADVELLYMFNLGNVGSGMFDAFEINYRYFQELSPESAIELADLDRYKYAAYKLSFGNNLFVAYATGKLPFDRTSDQIVKVGFSYDFKD
jgi:hypothetical protein